LRPNGFLLLGSGGGTAALPGFEWIDARSNLHARQRGPAQTLPRFVSGDDQPGINDELRQANDELSRRNDEIAQLGDDLANMVDSAGIPILLVGRDKHLRRFTPAAGMLFSLGQDDVGTALADLDRRLSVSGLASLTVRAIESRAPVEDFVQVH